MNLSSPAFVFLGIFFLGFGGPILAAKVWLHYRLKKGTLALKNGKRAGEPKVEPFDPKPEPAPGIFLRRFSLPQRSYLRREERVGRLGYLLGSWILLVWFSENLPPQMADSQGLALSLPQSVWYGYLWFGFHFDLVMCGLAAAVFAVAVVGRKSMKCERTLPLTLRFIFWSRAGVMLTSLVAAIVTAALGFFLLMLIFYGPVWNHVPSPIDIPGITKQQADHVISTLQTSPLRLVLSLLTTSMVIFSLVVAIRSLPWSFTPRSNSKLAATLKCLYWMAGTVFVGLFVLWGTESSQLARVLFLYNDKNAGPAPSYAYALLPVMISAALLELARFFNSRNEIS